MPSGLLNAPAPTPFGTRAPQQLSYAAAHSPWAGQPGSQAPGQPSGPMPSPDARAPLPSPAAYPNAGQPGSAMTSMSVPPRRSAYFQALQHIQQPV